MVEKQKRLQRRINILAFFAACIAIFFEHNGNREIYMFLKPLTTILIMSLLIFVPKNVHSKFRNLMLAAFLFCLVGDILLLFDSYFVFGLASFLWAHLLFSTSFINLKGFGAHILSFLMVFGVGVILFFWLKPNLGEFMVPVALYVLVICFMAWQGIGLYFRNKGRAYSWIALAVLLFMLSDTMIAIAKFKSTFVYSNILILGTYWLSIGLLANATYRIILDGKTTSN